MGEDLIEFLSEWNKIGQNIENMIWDVIHNEDVPLLIRADLLMRSGIGSTLCRVVKPFSLEELLEDMSNPDLTEEALESYYEKLDWFVRNDVSKIVQMYE